MPDPGWYNDERDPARARWHDGHGWTEHTIVKAEWPSSRGKPPPPASDDWGTGPSAPPVTPGPARKVGGGMQRITPLSPDQAVAKMVPLLTSGGATITMATSTAITGSVATKKGPSFLVFLILLLIMILPGLLYLLFGGKTITEPFSITLTPTVDGTVVTGAGTGRGEKAAKYAIKHL